MIQKKIFTRENVGKVKYLVDYYDGIKRYKDGSPLYDTATFTNKKKRDTFIKKLLSEGYKLCELNS